MAPLTRPTFRLVKNFFFWHFLILVKGDLLGSADAIILITLTGLRGTCTHPPSGSFTDVVRRRKSSPWPYFFNESSRSAWYSNVSLERSLILSLLLLLLFCLIYSSPNDKIWLSVLPRMSAQSHLSIIVRTGKAWGYRGRHYAREFDLGVVESRHITRGYFLFKWCVLMLSQVCIRWGCLRGTVRTMALR